MAQTAESATTAETRQKGTSSPKRLTALDEHLSLTRLEVRRDHVENVVVVIPTYSVNRRDLIDTAVQSVLGQARYSQTPSISLVIADNGLSKEDQVDLRKRVQSLILDQNLTTHLEIVDAHPAQPRTSAPSFQKTAAFARNQALTVILEQAKSDPRFRGDMFFIDDDAALVGPSLPILLGALRADEERRAIVPRFLPTTDLKSDFERLSGPALDQVDLERAIESTRDLPGQFKGNQFDLSAVLAFSGDLSTKTAALAVDGNLISRLHQHNKMVFKVYPNGSFEDLAFGAVASRQGKIAINPLAECLDLTRLDQESLKAQKVQWGRDHVRALSDFVDLDLLHNGITILEPINDGESSVWTQWHLESPNERGVIINPNQLRTSIIPELRRQITDGAYDDLAPIITRSDLLSHLNQAEARVLNVLNHVSGQYFERPDLGIPDLTPGGQGTRFALPVLAYQVAGNLVGTYEVNKDGGDLYKFVLGCRQKSMR